MRTRIIMITGMTSDDKIAAVVYGVAAELNLHGAVSGAARAWPAR